MKSTSSLNLVPGPQDNSDQYATIIVNITSSNNTHRNGSDEEDFYYDYDPSVLLSIHVLYVILSTIVLVIGLIGNALVWFAVWRNPRMRSATNIFLVNLAVADFMVILICLPPSMAENIAEHWYLGREICKIVKYLQKVSVVVSVLTLTAISIERWMAICRPLLFRQTSVRALRTIAIVWTIALLSAIPEAVSMNAVGYENGTILCQPAWSMEKETIHIWTMLALFYVIPLGIMTFTYAKVALCLWQSGFLDDNDEASANVPRAQILLRRKKAKMLIVVVAMFAFCYLPVYLLFLLDYLEFLSYLPPPSIKPLFMLSQWLCYFNSAFNPAIYNFMSCNFRREFRIACHICCRRGSNHNTIYEAVRMRKINKYQKRKQERASGGTTLTEHSLALNTQTSMLGPSASSFCSINLPHHSSSSSIAVPGSDSATGATTSTSATVNGGTNNANNPNANANANASTKPSKQADDSVENRIGSNAYYSNGNKNHVGLG